MWIKIGITPDRNAIDRLQEHSGASPNGFNLIFLQYEDETCKRTTTSWNWNIYFNSFTPILDENDVHMKQMATNFMSTFKQPDHDTPVI